MNPLITIRVPATSANLGSGFDTIGMAVSLYNIFKVMELLPEHEYRIEAHGEEIRELSDPSTLWSGLTKERPAGDGVRAGTLALVP